MTFLPPTFNVVANIWRSGDGPPLAPAVVSQAQLYVRSRASIPIDRTSTSRFDPAVFVRLPAGTDVRVGDVVEIEAGTGFLYHVRWVERVHLGFPNAYVEALVQQSYVPTPEGPYTILLNGLYNGNNVTPQTVWVMGVDLPAGLLIINAAYVGSALQTVNSIDLDGNPLTFVQAVDEHAAAFIGTSMFYLVIPDSPTGILTITMNEAVSNINGCITVVDGATTLDQSAVAVGGPATSPNITLPAAVPVARTFVMAFPVIALSTPDLDANAPFLDGAQDQDAVQWRFAHLVTSVVSTPTATFSSYVGRSVIIIASFIP